MRMKLRDPMPSLDGATGRANGDATKNALVGSPALVLFWAASCSCCAALLARVEAWRTAYGVQAVGVHVPRGATDDEASARRAIERSGAAYPVLLDGEGTLARAFGAARVPALYVFDAAGRLRHAQVGDRGLALLERRVRTVAQAIHMNREGSAE
ncbi:MAG TPA: TlpA disulfide reductase family protein [Paenibacillus sp.]|nr:TlpA disulfide reductase family protein [Paenibacillus sp.]